jgi:hypothetical protein
MGWVHDVPADDLYDHEGYTVACAADGTQLLRPDGSGSSIWFAFDGTKGYPRAERVKAACECGWQAAASFPLDWDVEIEVTEGDEDGTGPYLQWTEHIEELRGTRVPADFNRALADLRNVLSELTTASPLAAVQAAKLMEASGAFWLTESVKAAKSGGASWTEVGKALGTSKQNAHERFRHVTAD